MNIHFHSLGSQVARLLAWIVASIPAFAATINWKDGSGSWEYEARWLPKTVPDAGDTAAIGGLGSMEVRLDGFNSVSTLVLSNPNATLRVPGSAQTGQAMLTVANGFLNDGTIELSSEVGGNPAQLTVTTGSLTTAGGQRALKVNLDNRGTLTVLQDLTINGNLFNGGNVELPEGRIINIPSPTVWTHQIGAITGTGTLSLAVGSTFVLEKDFTPGNSALNAPNLTTKGPGRLVGHTTGEFRIQDWTINATTGVSGDLRARLKTRTLNVEEDPEQDRLDLDSCVNLRHGLDGPHLRGRGARGNANSSYRYQPLRWSMDVSRDDFAQACTNGQTKNPTSAHHRCATLYHQGWLSLALTIQELSPL